MANEPFISTQTRTYNSVTGVECEVTMAGRQIGNLQGVSHTVTREKGPNYVMGSANPRTFSRGKRGIAGSMIMLMLDRSNLLESLGERAKFWSSALDYSRMAQARSADEPDTFRNKANLDLSGAVVPSREFQGRLTLAFAWYHDQIPPFDVVLTALTELGLAARMAINGVDILNSGSGVSIDDITTDENFTYVATSLSPWRALEATPPTYEGLVKPIGDLAAGMQRNYS
jgi:hypothetical protein